MQRQEPERKRNKNFAGLWQSCFLLHGVDERENDDLDSIGQTQPLRTDAQARWVLWVGPID
jgi:hypothetical protein